MQEFETVVAVALCLAATVTDLRSGRIPNALTLAALALGIALAGAQDATVLLHRALAAAAVLAISMFFFSWGWLGAGDGKLFTAIAALKGGRFASEAALWTILIGGVVSAVVLARRGELSAFVARLIPAGSVDGTSQARKSQIPMAPIIAVGVVVAVVASALGLSFVQLLVRGGQL